MAKQSRSSKKKTKNGRQSKVVRKKERELEVDKETLRAALAVLIFVFAIILYLAPFGMAGNFGNYFYQFTHLQLGVAYYILPTSLLLASASIYSAKKKKIGKVKTAAIFTFFLSAIALFELMHEGAGGKLGKILLSPVSYAFGKVAGGLLLFALASVSVFVSLDTHPIKILSKIKERFESYDEEDEFEEDIPQNKKERLARKSSTVERKRKVGATEKLTESVQKIKEKVEDTIVSISEKKEKEDDKVKMDAEDKVSDTENYRLPPIKLLDRSKGKASVGDAKAKARAIKQTLAEFGIPVEMDEIKVGSTITRYTLKPAQGVKLDKIVNLKKNLEFALASSPIRIEAPIPGKALVGIEAPNTQKAIVRLGTLIASSEFQNNRYELPIALGEDVVGNKFVYDLAKAPHLLVAGSTSSGKSITVHDMIISLLYKYGPEKLRFVFVDAKRVELTLYNGIPHLLTPTVTDAKTAVLTLKWLIDEMERRYEILEEYQVQNIKDYHNKVLPKLIKKQEKDPDLTVKKMPYIVVVVDELAEIMMEYPKELETAIVRLAQKARAVGIHLILATQRPDTSVVTGLIKANIPSRVALKVPSQIDSRTIIDRAGAENLIGRGDMLFVSVDMPEPKRLQAPFVSKEEIREVVKYIKQSWQGEMFDEIDLSEVGKDNVVFSSGTLFDSEEDERNSDEYQAALRFVIETGKASASLLQRRFRIGYNKAARFIDMMEEDGVIGPPNGSKPREVLVSSLEELAQENNEPENEYIEGGEESENENKELLT